jgi:hypothetical protein
MVPLAGFAADALLRTARRSNPRRRRPLGLALPPGGTAVLAVVLAVVVAAVESVPVGARLAAAPTPTTAPWAAALAHAPVGNVALVPFPASGSADDYLGTTEAMLQLADRRHPLVNGYTGLFPHDYLVLWDAMQAFPTLCSGELLQRHSTRYLVIVHAWLTATRRAGVEALGYRPYRSASDHEIWVDSGALRLHDNCG